MSNKLYFKIQRVMRFITPLALNGPLVAPVSTVAPTLVVPVPMVVPTLVAPVSMVVSKLTTGEH